MKPASHPEAQALCLGIEGGGTRTVALVADPAGRALRRLEAGPANLKLLTDPQLVRQFRSLGRRLPRPAALGIGLAGAWAKSDCDRIRRAAAKVWPGVPCHATNDLETALTAARPSRFAQVLIVSGTGSGCYGRRPNGQDVKVGSWGHVLGDQGSGYEIGLAALRRTAQAYDETERWPDLGRRLLRALQLNEPNELIGWAQAATKTEIAALAIDVFAAREHGDRLSGQILARAAGRLAQSAALCARKIAPPGRRVDFVLAGSLLQRQPRFRARLARELRRLRPAAVVTPLQREGVWGAVELARRSLRTGSQPTPPRDASLRTPAAEAVRSTRLSPTEQRNRRSLKLDRLGIEQGIQLMLSEEARTPRRLLAERRRIAQVVRAVVRAFRSGGRLFYVGAGTSGRLGVLDASECPPTFRTPPDLVQGIIAGGQSALWRSIEGAEDDAAAGARAVEFRGIGRRDVVVGIAASGTTPFVWGALRAARDQDATTALVCFNPHLKIPRRQRPDIVIAPSLGAEVLTGSTRLKAGTATKLLLNLFTTLAMVRVGKVMSNLMVDLHPANVKLQDRAARIVQALTAADYRPARQALAREGWIIKKAIARLRRTRPPRSG
jgi:N-acetylmuramic acid 6-phosphate etherase